MPPPIAYFAMLLPILALMIPIVAILTHHQREMAGVLRRDQGRANPEILALRQEVQELKQLIHQQAIAMDNMMSLQPRTTPPPNPLQERIKNGAG